MKGRHIYTHSILLSNARFHESNAKEQADNRNKALLEGDINVALHIHQAYKTSVQLQTDYVELADILKRIAE